MGIQPLYRALLDDAALFPPARLPMAKAIAGHLRHQSAWYADMCGPFVCTAAALTTLSAALTAANVPDIAIALVVPGGEPEDVAAATEVIAHDPRLRLRAVEVRAIEAQAGEAHTSEAHTGEAHTGETTAAAAEDGVARAVRALDTALLAGANGYVEIPVAAVSTAPLALVVDHGYRVKLRTGGLTAEAFPAEDVLAAAIFALAAQHVPFKCTAGLHHAVRHTTPDGMEQHGFLNVILATSAAQNGADPVEITARLAERDAAAVVAHIGKLDEDAAAAARAHFISFGTCSTDEPVADLVALGLAAAQ